MIVPTPANVVTAALTKRLQESTYIAGITGDRVTVERSAQGDDPSKCPWVCVFRFATRFPSRVLGVPTGFRYHELDLGVVVQATSHASGEDCEDRLEELMAAVVATVLEDPTIGGTVVHIKPQMDVQYPDQRLKDDLYMQTAVLIFTAETTVAVTE